MAGNGGNSLREALQERGWSYTRLAAELRRHAGGLQLPKTESLVTLISRWVNNHQQPDDFYRDLLAKALGRSRADLFGDEGESKLGVLAVPAELPHDVAGFIGRSGEIDDLRRRLLGTGRVASGAVVTIDGPPGVGKSALAVHLAHQLCEHFPNAQLFANLRGDEGEGLDPTVVLHQFLRALGATSEEIPSTIETAARAYRSRLAGKRVLIVLDNAVSERQVRPLLPGSPTCAVLITSRCPLPGLAEATALTLELLPTSDAVRMLGQVAGPERVGGSEAATRVVSQCGHLPLALRIAGARLRTRRAWTVETLAAFMEDERQRLGRLAMGELGIRASFSLSYQQLEPEAARTFRLLSLLGMPEISVGVAAAVTDRELPDAEAALEQLADAALVEALTARQIPLPQPAPPIRPRARRGRGSGRDEARGDRRGGRVVPGARAGSGGIARAGSLRRPDADLPWSSGRAGLAGYGAREPRACRGRRRRARPGGAMLADGRRAVPLLRAASVPDRLAASQPGRPARCRACQPA